MDEPIVYCEGGPDALPEYQSDGASGADLRALLPEAITLKPGQHSLVPTGLHVEIPPGYEGQIRPRSGLAARHGITVLNAPGTIDSDYRGEIKVVLVNLGDADFRISTGDRVAQIVICPVIRVSFRRKDRIAETRRGSGGFGSTGV